MRFRSKDFLLRTMKLEGSWTSVNTRPTWQAKMSLFRNGGGHQLQDGTLLMIHAAACGQKTVQAICLLKFQRTLLRPVLPLMDVLWSLQF
ncbi:unnamed protein product [Ixodes persulcatus]